MLAALPSQTQSQSSASDAPPVTLPYRPEPGAWDEMLAADGSVRPHWQGLAQHLADSTPAQWNQRSASIQRLLLDHGVTYNIYNDAKGAMRPWALDAVPFIVAREEWRSVATGLHQRSRLLNAILADLYGPQQLLRDGWLPPAIVHANPAFLRPACGVVPPCGAFLVSMGTDLVRGPDGAWMALADRTQAPSGRGYSFENRNILSSVLGEVFESSQVDRLGSFFEAERDALRRLAPTRRGSPSVVLLTPGPLNETYFEHAYKSRIMGYPLVEGADLTVRDRKLYLKTLDGLRRVDVVLRHVDDIFADPLELRADTWLGVAGMVEAWRSGNVSLVNGIGTGAVETPALHPFLPGICRHLLGEELKLPGVPTWWCGQPREMAMVLENPRRWVLKPAFSSGPREPFFLEDLSQAEMDKVLAGVQAEPHAWVAQEYLKLSNAPVWTGSRLEPRPLVWRAFTINDGEHCTVMPGGLSRVSPVPGRFVVTMQRGGISKDTWVINDEASATEAEPTPPPAVLRPLRTPGGVPSRAADHLFWLGRYAERLESHARLLRTTLQRLSGEGSIEQRRERRACLQLLRNAELLPGSTGEAALRGQVHLLLTDPKCPGSVPDLVSRLHYNASAARDRLSDDSWRLFNRLERDAEVSAGTVLDSATARGLLDTLMLDLAAFAGMQQENMTRGHGWRFLETGRRIERAIRVLSLVKTAAASCAGGNAILTPLLEVCDSTMTYRRLHFAAADLLPVADLLLLNEDNPRSVAFQFHRLGRAIAQLPAGTSGVAGTEREQLDVLRSELASLNLSALTNHPETAQELIPEVCARLADGVEELSVALTEHFFSHALRRGE